MVPGASWFCSRWLFSLSCAAICKLLAINDQEFGSIIVASNCVVISLIFIFNLYFLIKCFRMELFHLEDEPIIFDCRNRKFHRIYRQIKPGLKGLFCSWPIRSAVYDWDLTHAEHHSVTTANTATINRIHALVFSVRANDADPAVVDGFKIGSCLEMGDVTVAPMYDHIRKFMEEKGPHLPDGENTAKKIKSPTLSECLANTGPYGQTLRHWWVNARGLTIFAVLFFPITFPILTLLEIFSWSSYATSIPIRWPEQVIEAIGEPIEENGINSSGLMGG